ncbi:phenazine biosynthesis-like domain-containing protein isoform X1 [Corythoichthys intestinalis]|uniref:phenazine biosynthesis-like domain-containing protein isoform X1 n=1 Tax=Corythoichthys intestinalis TaxID=161448 RepID=UPI0025A62C2E|nr:phenazine biosynthesis-like domain-containing protein isoform X1 [Corythoichthys intestinalis]
MEIPMFVVDAFTNLPFKGNPAAVCLLKHELPDKVYQEIAMEMNLSETVFITTIKPSKDFTNDSRFQLRWFTPTTEVNLCGHATLASAAVLFKHKKNVNSAVVFETRSGDLTVVPRGEVLVMDFPLNPPTKQTPDDFETLIKVSETNISRSRLLFFISCIHVSLFQAAVGNHPVQDVYYSTSTKKLLLRLSDSCDRSVLTSLQVNPETLLSSDQSGQVKGLIVTVKGSSDHQSGYDFFSRYFAPWNGIPEDPVTGSAHTVLGSYWSEKLGKRKMLAFQCSRRGGELEVEVREDGRINIAGKSVTVLQGTITL